MGVNVGLLGRGKHAVENVRVRVGLAEILALAVGVLDGLGQGGKARAGAGKVALHCRAGLGGRRQGRRALGLQIVIGGDEGGAGEDGRHGHAHLGEGIIGGRVKDMRLKHHPVGLGQVGKAGARLGLPGALLQDAAVQIGIGMLLLQGLELAGLGDGVGLGLWIKDGAAVAGVAGGHGHLRLVGRRHHREQAGQWMAGGGGAGGSALLGRGGGEGGISRVTGGSIGISIGIGVDGKGVGAAGGELGAHHAVRALASNHGGVQGVVGEVEAAAQGGIEGAGARVPMGGGGGAGGVGGGVVPGQLAQQEMHGAEGPGQVRQELAVARDDGEALEEAVEAGARVGAQEGVGSGEGGGLAQQAGLVPVDADAHQPLVAQGRRDGEDEAVLAEGQVAAGQEPVDALGALLRPHQQELVHDRGVAPVGVVLDEQLQGRERIVRARKVRGVEDVGGGGVAREKGRRPRGADGLAEAHAAGRVEEAAGRAVRGLQPAGRVVQAAPQGAGPERGRAGRHALHRN